MLTRSKRFPPLTGGEDRSRSGRYRNWTSRSQTSSGGQAMKWITRKNVKVDRVACPWLIQRFIDPDAEFLFVEEAELLDIAAREDAIPFDAPRLSAVRLNHRGERCTFEAIIE